MRLIKMFGFAGAIAASAIFLLGASSAMATTPQQLCKVNVTPCPAGQGVTTIHMVSTNALLEGMNPNVHIECKESLLQANVLGLASPQSTHISSLTWTKCMTPGGTECEINSIKQGLVNFLRTVQNLATVTTANTEILVYCDFGATKFHCEYPGLSFVFEGANHAGGAHKGLLKANANVLEKLSLLLCPEETKFTATYESLVNIFGSE